MSATEGYLKAILAMLARQAIPVDELKKIVAPKGDGKKQITAYNLCNGQRNQSEVAKLSGINAANLQKTLVRWESQGIIVRNEYDGEIHPVHVYPLPT